MQFDVIIGNPPYQLDDGGHGTSATPIYHQFVEQAKRLEPRFLSMIIPSRWFGGGKGLSEFRAKMLGDDHIRELVDYENVKEVFPGVDLAGGVCYFLWDRETQGLCEVTNVVGETCIIAQRRLNEFQTFVRHSAALPIIRKVLAKSPKRMHEQVSSRKPFGLPTNARPETTGDLILRWEKGVGPYPRHLIEVGKSMIDKWKVITSKVSSEHAGTPAKDGTRKVLSRIEILPPGSICTETYLIAGCFDSAKEAEQLVEYLKTRFVRFLSAQMSFSQDITKDRFVFVPVVDLSTSWNDKKLSECYALTNEEVEYIESKVRPFDVGGSDD